MCYAEDVSISQRLYPTPAQELVLKRHCADSRFVYNLGLEQRNMYRPEKGPTPNLYEQSRQLTEARAEFEWLRNGSRKIQEGALRDLDQAFQNWWKRPDHYGRPNWRKGGKNEGFSQGQIERFVMLNAQWAEITIYKVGRVKFRLTRPWPEFQVAKSFRVTQNRAGEWHISFLLPQPTVDKDSTGSVVGIDMGIAHTVTDSNGNHLEMPTLLSPGESQRKVRLQRQLSRRVKGSNRYERTRKSRAKITQCAASRRKDWLEKTTTQLVHEHDVLVIEDLKVQNMVRSAKGTIENPGKNVAQKRGLNRSIHNQGWYEFRKRLTEKASAATFPTFVVPVPPAYTSQRCSECGHTEKKNRKNQASFSCVSCSFTTNADVNAARNILAAGLAVAGRGGIPHSDKELSSKSSGPMKRQLEVV
jgi:putative transposase